jgi:hypothetical protein
MAKGGYGVYLDSGPDGIDSGGYQVAEYFGDEWMRPPSGIVHDAYVFEVGGRLIKASADSVAGHMNDNFEASNCCSDEMPDHRGGLNSRIMVIRLTRPVLPNQLFELSFNYGKAYWTEARLQALPPETEARARHFYHLPARTRFPRAPEATQSVILRPVPTETSDSTVATVDPTVHPVVHVMLLGMVYSTVVDPDQGGQCYRDRLRAAALEAYIPGCRVTTVDDKHEGCNPLVEPDRHICANFNAPSRLFKAWRRLQHDGTLDSIILDYVFSPAGWVQTRWSDGLFQFTIPTLATDGLLRPGGSVWLPGTDYIRTSLLKHEQSLREHFVVFTRQRLDNPLFAATLAVEAELALDKDPATEDPPQFFYQLIYRTEEQNHHGKREQRKFIELHPFKKQKAHQGVSRFLETTLRIPGRTPVTEVTNSCVRTLPEIKGVPDIVPASEFTTQYMSNPHNLLFYFRPKASPHPESNHYHGTPPSGIG